MSNRSRPPRAAAPVATRRRNSVRIIGGKWKRSVLPVVDVPGLRPTPDRVRETLFNWLAHARGGNLDGFAVLDLFAGSGALGFEAASRGAARVLMIESDPAVVRQLTSVRDHLATEGRVEIWPGDALVLGTRLREAKTAFDLIFLDPPFGQRRLDNALPLAVALCNAAGFIYAEAEAPIDPGTASALGLEIYREDRAGEVFYHLLRRNKKEP